MFKSILFLAIAASTAVAQNLTIVERGLTPAHIHWHCTKDSQCAHKVHVARNAKAICHQKTNTCKLACGKGHHLVNGKCLPKHQECHSARDCRNETLPKNGQLVCTANRKCDFKCKPGFKRTGNKCVKKHNECSASRDCRHKLIPNHSNHVCDHGKCSLTCNKNYSKVGNKCVLKPGTCKREQCKSLKNGSSSCLSNGKCKYTCNSGYLLSHGNNCVRTGSTDNCSRLGDSCPEPYGGNGKAECKDGKCGIACNSGYRLTSRFGIKICIKS